MTIPPVRLGLVSLAAAMILRGASSAPVIPAGTEVLPGTFRLEERTGLPALIVRQWDAHLLGAIAQAKVDRERQWQCDESSPEAYARSRRGNREHLQRMIGAIDARVTVTAPERVLALGQPETRAETAAFSAQCIRWPVFPNVHGEGLLLRPKAGVRACVVVIPDADQTPEMLAGIAPGVAPESQIGRLLAENGLLVVIPTLLDRTSRWSRDDRLAIQTDQTHREWIYRQAGEVGRHPIGYEVQKIQAVIDWFAAPNGPGAAGKIGVAGYGEGGLLALYAAALDERIVATWVSGYFQPREEVWREPLYRNLWGLLTEFGDAELAAMVAPRGLVVEHSGFPAVVQPSPRGPAPKGVRQVGGAGRIVTPDYAAVAAEWERARKLAGTMSGKFELVAGAGGNTVPFGSLAAAQAFGRGLGVPQLSAKLGPFLRQSPFSAEETEARQYRQVHELQEYTQARLRLAEYERERFFWSKLKMENPEQWNRAVQDYRTYFWDEVIGRFSGPALPFNARTRRLDAYTDAQVTTYEVLLDVLPGVETWGYLILPADLKPGERRPVVVCQHGANGQPASALDPDDVYKDFARRLARRGFVVYAPFNPNKLLNEEFRQLQRKGNVLKKTVFGIFAANHQRVLDWLKTQPFVDPRRLAFYGLSYGGKTAVRVPAVLEDYCLSICSGDFNDYVQKVTSVRSDKNSFMFVDSYENVQFNLGNTFNYAEMAALIAPRPFMVEHGYLDKVAPLEWAAAEYAKVQKLYFYLGIPGKTAMAFFDGPHMIHGEETFKFLHRQLRWPESSAR